METDAALSDLATAGRERLVSTTAFAAIGAAALALTEADCAASAVFLEGTTLGAGLAEVFFAGTALVGATEVGLALASDTGLAVLAAVCGFVLFEVFTSCLLAVPKGQIPERLHWADTPQAVRVNFSNPYL